MAEKSIDDYIVIGMEYCDKGDFDQGIKYISEAIRLDPNNASSYETRGLAYLRMVKAGVRNKVYTFEHAVKDFSKAISLDPNSADAYAGRGELYHADERYGKAFSDLKTALKLKPEDDETRQFLDKVKSEMKHRFKKEDRNMIIGFLISVIVCVIFVSANPELEILAAVIMGVFFGIGGSSIWLTAKTIFTKLRDILENILFSRLLSRLIESNDTIKTIAGILLILSYPFFAVLAFYGIFIAPVVGIVRFIKRRLLLKEMKE